MHSWNDGPRSPLFDTLKLQGGVAWSAVDKLDLPETLRSALVHAPRGECTSWGIPFTVGNRIAVASAGKTVSLRFGAVKAPALVFMHSADQPILPRRADGVYSPATGYGALASPVADYVFVYEDGSECRHTVRRRHEVNMFQRPWGESSFGCVSHRKPAPVYPLTQQPDQPYPWGQSQTRALYSDLLPWTNWIWAWENPHPRKALVGLRVEAREGAAFVFGITAARTKSVPYRWETRCKAVLKLPVDVAFDRRLEANGSLHQIQLDLGQVISAEPRRCYENGAWEQGFNNQVPETSSREILIECTAHPEARFHLWNGKTVPVAKLSGGITPVAPATQRVTLRVVDRESGKPVPVKVHVHGEAGEYLAPLDRHRYPNFDWYEDLSADFVHQGLHNCAYIGGETTIDLPLGRVYVEVSKGFEVRPVRRVLEVRPSTKTITIPIEKVLRWREQGWVTADTHVHFISPTTGLLEGAAEGVNVVNLLASQWGELFTNIGDFDGRNTWGSKETGGDGEHLLRVGTENRQHVLGHISLLGYRGRAILPLTTGGPDESALGDPVDVLLCEWARQCRKQGGIVVLPHFAQPRAEHAACLVEGLIDGVEMTSWGDLYHGIDPYSISDWYRYLNCGHFVPAVAGTDKMSANTPVGAVRTYARIPEGREFTYASWMEAIRSGHTFVTYGPLLDFAVEGKVPGERIAMTRSGGRVSVHWNVASVTVPMTRVDLVVNGEIRERVSVKPWAQMGDWSIEVDRSSWLALLVRGQYPGKPEMIAAHSSPVTVAVEGSPFFAAADAATILEQIEGVLAFIGQVGTRAEDKAYKRMRRVLTGAWRRLHNRMHEMGYHHEHGH